MNIAVVASGFLGDTIACTAAASSLHDEFGYQVDFFCKWGQLISPLQCEPRFNSYLYKDSKIGQYILNRKLSRYDRVIKEPFPWSYKEPFTSEIRRLANCNPHSKLDLNLVSNQDLIKKEKLLVSVSKNLYSRNYGRNIDDFISKLGKKFNIRWVGLEVGKETKKGQNVSMEDDLVTMLKSQMFIGPEGGLLWVATALGIPTVYFSEHINHVNSVIKSGNAWMSLGAENINGTNTNKCLPLGCSNHEAVQEILNHYSSIRNS